MYENVYHDATMGHNHITINTTTDFGKFHHNLVWDSIENKKVNYLFETGKDLKNKPFKDFRKEYFHFNPINADTLPGTLIETYQKYNDVFIGTHTWYKYRLVNKEEKNKKKIIYITRMTEEDLYEDLRYEMLIDKQIFFDAIYPICWSKAIKIARKKGVKANQPKLIPPTNYPYQKQEKGQAFWIVSDYKVSIKIDAYSGKIIE